MANYVEKMDLAFERDFHSFELKNLKDPQQKALQNLVNAQDLFIIQPTLSGKSLRH